MNASQLAQRIHEDPKKLRKFLRDTTPRENRPGLGHQWNLSEEKKSIRQLTRRYRRWAEDHTRKMKPAL